MSKFKENVEEIIAQIPKGKVASYGQVAVLAGAPRAARQVGWILRTSNKNLPWWRVVATSGKIIIKNLEITPYTQREKLLDDGVEVNEQFTVNMKKYRFDGAVLKKRYGITEEEIDFLDTSLSSADVTQS